MEYEVSEDYDTFECTSEDFNDQEANFPHTGHPAFENEVAQSEAATFNGPPRPIHDIDKRLYLHKMWVAHTLVVRTVSDDDIVETVSIDVARGQRVAGPSIHACGCDGETVFAIQLRGN